MRAHTNPFKSSTKFQGDTFFEAFLYKWRNGKHFQYTNDHKANNLFLLNKEPAKVFQKKKYMEPDYASTVLLQVNGRVIDKAQYILPANANAIRIIRISLLMLNAYETFSAKKTTSDVKILIAFAFLS